VSGSPPIISTKPAVTTATRPLWIASSRVLVGFLNSAAVRAFAGTSSTEASIGEASKMTPLEAPRKCRRLSISAAAERYLDEVQIDPLDVAAIPGECGYL
jgi:hypothetical protein